MKKQWIVGGEEFCVILPGASLTQAAEVAERIRLKLNEKEMLIAKSTTIRISASLGVRHSASPFSGYRAGRHEVHWNMLLAPADHHWRR